MPQIRREAAWREGTFASQLAERGAVGAEPFA